LNEGSNLQKSKTEKEDVKMSTVKASFDTETVAGQMKVFNAQNGASKSMKDLESGTIIEAVGVLTYEDTVDSYGKPQDVTITVIFAQDGTSYASVSDTVAKASDKLIQFLEKTKLEQFNVQIIKETSRGGNEFLNLQLVG
jgi:hypothetical protein